MIQECLNLCHNCADVGDASYTENGRIPERMGAVVTHAHHDLHVPLEPPSVLENSVGIESITTPVSLHLVANGSSSCAHWSKSTNGKAMLKLVNAGKTVENRRLLNLDAAKASVRVGSPIASAAVTIVRVWKTALRPLHKDPVLSSKLSHMAADLAESIYLHFRRAHICCPSELAWTPVGT
jgi:hypothetical protein